jgi:UDP:flavonoid glycosyltransferase YjiC (YdhE family)
MRIVFTPWGSLGDLHPYLAVALEMKRRGHQIAVATSSLYRGKVMGEGLEFYPVRPDMRKYIEDPKKIGEAMSTFRGSETIFRQMLMPNIRDMYEDLNVAAEGADLLVGHVAMCATPLVAEKKDIRWISIVLQPALVWSDYDPPYLPLIGNALRLSRGVSRIFRQFARKETERWIQPLYALRRELGLPLAGKHPLFEGQYSPAGSLAFFSPVFAPPQADWPTELAATGFPFYDKLEPGKASLTGDIEEFLAAGEAPVVFTLGSTAAYVPSRFYETSAEVIERMKIRGILLAGSDFKNRLNIRSTKNMLIAEYAPYSKIFPRAAAVVHSGGVGTTAQALRSGIPMIVTPFSHDQPDNGARVTRLGTGMMIPRWNYKTRRVERDLTQLLSNGLMAARAAEVGRAIQAESGTAAAAIRIEELALRETRLEKRAFTE